MFYAIFQPFSIIQCICGQFSQLEEQIVHVSEPATFCLQLTTTSHGIWAQTTAESSFTARSLRHSVTEAPRYKRACARTLTLFFGLFSLSISIVFDFTENNNSVSSLIKAGLSHRHTNCLRENI